MKMVRDGQKVWPYCEECGCRLEVNPILWYEFKAHDILRHFPGETFETDGRGHKCSKIFVEELVPNG